MRRQFPAQLLGRYGSMIIAMFAVAGYVPSQNQQMARTNSVLTNVGKYAEDSFYACLLNGCRPLWRRPYCQTVIYVWTVRPLVDC